MPILTEQQRTCDPEDNSFPSPKSNVPGGYMLKWMYGQWHKKTSFDPNE